MRGEERPDRLRRDPGGGVRRVAVDPAADRRERDRFAPPLRRGGQRVAVAGGEPLGFAVPPAVPDRADGVNDPLRRQVEAGRDPHLPGRAPHAGGDLGDRPAGRRQPRPGGAVDRPVHPAAPQHPFVRRVHDGIDRQRRDVAADDANPGRNRTRGRTWEAAGAVRTGPHGIVPAMAPPPDELREPAPTCEPAWTRSTTGSRTKLRRNSGRGTTGPLRDAVRGLR